MVKQENGETENKDLPASVFIFLSHIFLFHIFLSALLQNHLSTFISYQVVTCSPSVTRQPSGVFMAGTGAPMRCPRPSRAAIVTLRAPSRLRRSRCPVTGSITVGAVPHCFNADLVSFHSEPVLVTTAPATSNMRPDRAIGLASRALRLKLLNRLLTSGARWRNFLSCALTNPMAACVRSVSTVTSPPISGDTAQTSSPVSDTIGSASRSSIFAVGCPSSEAMRDPWRSGSDNGKPGVKYVFSVPGRRMLS